MNSLFKENRTLNLVDPLAEARRGKKLARQEAGKLAGSGTFEGQTSTQLAQKLTPKAPIVTKPKKVVQPKSGGTILTPEELKQRRADAFSTPREESKSAAERGATIVPDIPTAKTAQEIAAETGANVGDAFSSLTPTQRLENLVAQQKDEEKQLELKLAPKRSRIAEQLEAAKAGAETRFAESAEGVQTSTAAGLVSRATAGAETQAQASLDTMNAAQESLRQLNQRIQTKAVRGEETRQLEQQAAGIQKAIDEATEELEASGAKATQDVFDLVQNSDQAQLESFANMDSSSFFDTIKLRSPNITLPQSLILQDLAKSRFKAGKLDPESIEGRAALAKVQAAESALLSEADKQIKNFQKLKAALDAGEISQAFFDKETLGVEPVSRLDTLKEEEQDIKNQIAREELAEFSDDDVVGQRYNSVVTGEGNAGVVTQDFGATSPVSSDNRDVLMLDGTTKKGTPGVDLDGRIGDPILSTVSGVVVDPSELLTKDDMTGLGTKVAVQDPEGNVHFFNHMSATDLEVGADVEKGDQIGSIGRSGTVIKGEEGGDGSHLDYRTQDTEGNWIDPRQFIDEFASRPKKLSPSDRGTLEIQIGKAAFGTRISDREGAKVEDIVGSVIKENPGITVPEIRDKVIDSLIGFTLTDNQEFGNVLKENLIINSPSDGLSGLDARGISRLINSGKLEAAMTKTEQIAMRNAQNLDPEGFIGEAVTIAAAERSNNISDLISELEDSPIGVVGGTMEDWLGRLKGKEATAIGTKIVSAVAEMRKRLLGSAVTPTENIFLQPKVPILGDSPANFLIKLEELKTDPLLALNSSRSIVSLPELDESTLLDKSQRVKLYEGGDPSELIVFDLEDEGEKAQFTEVQNTVQGLIDEGESDEDIEAYLIELGLDINQFI